MTTVRPQPHGGRGARERIWGAATRLFAEQDINNTGMAALTEVAYVSKRSFYQHFPSKDDLVRAYLERLDTTARPDREQILERTELPARERLLGVFADPPVWAGADPFADARSAAVDLVALHTGPSGLPGHDGHGRGRAGRPPAGQESAGHQRRSGSAASSG
ncbi:MAG TPA: TetR/AcrR family transcriptional regulator [Pseudonocardiaceae bacterium]|nr:TetR/AcrR family transcriptional regulator [Pseudonocardiaceae bacterium]